MTISELEADIRGQQRLLLAAASLSDQAKVGQIADSS